MHAVDNINYRTPLPKADNMSIRAIVATSPAQAMVANPTSSSGILQIQPEMVNRDRPAAELCSGMPRATDNPFCITLAPREYISGMS